MLHHGLFWLWSLLASHGPLCVPFPSRRFDPILVTIVIVGATPPAETQVSYFECFLLEPNSARTDAGPEGKMN